MDEAVEMAELFPPWTLLMGGGEGRGCRCGQSHRDGRGVAVVVEAAGRGGGAAVIDVAAVTAELSLPCALFLGWSLG